jgi:glycogen debranching enzyme
VLADIITWHVRGTRYGIRIDPADGLLRAGEPGVQLTWMDAKVADWVVTPRIGKPIEVNALWLNALETMTAFARRLGRPTGEYELLAKRARTSFARFWNPAASYCFDVLDGPNGNEAALRPNQLFAVSLPVSPLTPEQQRAVVDACARRLLTSHGLRSLDPADPAYIGRYGGGPRERDGAYHQGTVWGWLLGPFVLAHLRVYDDPAAAASYLDPMAGHLLAHGLGTASEIFDGDPPHTPRGCIAQAWTVAELLRAWLAAAVRLGASARNERQAESRPMKLRAGA